MQYLKKFFIPLAILIVSVVCFNLFKVIPVTKLWKNYTVLFVSIDYPSEKVLSLLRDKGCENVIALENQKVPLNVSQQSPEVALALSGMEKSDYLNRRADFFFDRNHNVKVYYIPEQFEKNVQDTVSDLRDEGILCGINTKSAYPWAAILIYIAFCGVLTFYSKDRKVTLTCVLFGLYFLSKVPFFTVAASLVLLQYVLFLFSRIYDREGSENYVISNICMITFIGASILVILSTGFKFLLLYVMLICSEYCLFQLSKAFEELKDRAFSFRPVKIRSAKHIKVYTKKTVFCMLLCFAGCLIIFGTSFLSFNFGVGNNGGSFSLPASKSGVGNLPGLDEFVDWKWEAMTYPYKSLYRNNFGKTDNGDTVYFKSYNMQDGKIVEAMNSISYNAGFKKNAVEEIDSLDFPAIEKVIKEQGTSKNFGYASAGSQSTSLLSLIFMVFSFVIPLIFYLNIKRWR